MKLGGTDSAANSSAPSLCFSNSGRMEGRRRTAVSGEVFAAFEAKVEVCAEEGDVAPYLPLATGPFDEGPEKPFV